MDLAPPGPTVPRDPRHRAARRAASAAFPLTLLPILGALFLVGWYTPFHEHRWLIGALVGAGLAWLAAVSMARTGIGDVRVVIAGALVLRLLALATPVQLSDDVYRYAWEGDLVLHGISPYAFAPEDPRLTEFRSQRAELFERVNHPDVPAAYPPLAQGVFAGVDLAAGGTAHDGGRTAVFLFRALFGLCDLLVLWPLIALLRRFGRPASLAVAWAWCPLTALSFAGSGHFDSLALLLLLAALAAGTWRGAAGGPPVGPRLTASALTALGTLVKLLPGVAQPFLARGRGAAARWALFAGVLAAGSLWVLALEGGFATTGLGEYGLRWESESLVYGYLEAGLRAVGLALDESLFDARRVGRALVLLVWLAVAWRQWRLRAHPARATGALVAAFLLLTPTLHPWYVAWIAPFVALTPRASWSWLLAAGPVLYQAPARYAAGGPYDVDPLLFAVLALPFLLLLVVELRGARHPLGEPSPPRTVA